MLRHIKPALDLLSTLVVIVAGTALLWRFYSPKPPAAGGRAVVESVSGLTLPSERLRHMRGDGTVALIAFSDYECPFCARHDQQTAPEIRTKWIETGQVREIYLNFPLPIHLNAQKASEAAECAARQGRFWEMHEALFRGAKALAISDLTGHAAKLGLSLQEFTECVESGRTSAIIKGDIAEGRRLDVRATPAFFVGLVRQDGAVDIRKRINGAAELKEFDRAIQELLPHRKANARGVLSLGPHRATLSQ